MRRAGMLTTMLLGGVTLTTACGGGNDEAASMGEAQLSSAEELTTPSGMAECYVANGTVEEAEARVSPLTRLRFAYDGGQALLCYGAPSLRGREFIGEIEPYGVPWRAGANEPTTLHLSTPARVGGLALEPGAYSLFVIPNEGDWQVVVNANYQRWGIPIDESVRATDVGAFAVTPSTLEAPVETLNFAWTAGESGGGVLSMRWETWEIAFPIDPAM